MCVCVCVSEMRVHLNTTSGVAFCASSFSSSLSVFLPFLMVSINYYHPIKILAILILIIIMKVLISYIAQNLVQGDF